MMKVTLATLFLTSAMLQSVSCQTFQYSRGWTNGKRSDASSSLSLLPELKVTDFPIRDSDRRKLDIVSMLCGQRSEVSCGSKSVLMVVPGNGRPKLYPVPCELLRACRSSANHEKQRDIPPMDVNYRPLLSNEYDASNDNY